MGSVDNIEMSQMTLNLNGPPTIILFQVARGPFNLIFTKQFKRITQTKLRVFILKVAN